MSRSILVASLSPAAEALGKSAPALKDARFLPFDRFRVDPPQADHVLVIGFWDDLDSSVLDFIYAATVVEDGPAMALALGGSDEELSAALGVTPRVAEDVWSGQLAILNYLDMADAGGDGWTILGKLAPDHLVASALDSRPASLLISTHGDGLDARLPANLHLCPAPWEEDDDEDERGGEAPANAPFCALSKHCYWLDSPFGSEACRRQLVTADRLSARTIIFDSCLGMQAGESLFPSRRLFVRKLAAQADCETIICFSGYQVEDGQRLLDMSYELARGSSAAALVRQYNRAASSRSLGRRAYLLHGRRWLGAEGQIEAGGAAFIRERELPPVAPPRPDLDAGERWTSWLADCAEQAKEERVAAALGSLLRPEIHSEERAVLLADLLCGLDTISLWSPQLGSGPVPEPAPCPVCGAALAATSAQRGIVRFFAQCHACSYYSDRDEVCRGSASLSAEGLLVVTGVRAGSEVRVRTAPAGCPKYPVRILRVPAPCEGMRLEPPVERSTALSFRAAADGGFSVDLGHAFDRPPLFVAVVVAELDGYSSETFTARTRAPYLRVPAEAVQLS